MIKHEKQNGAFQQILLWAAELVGDFIGISSIEMSSVATIAAWVYLW